MVKTIVSQLVLLTLFSINIFAANSPPRQKASLEFRFYVSSVAFSPDGSTLASGANGIGGSPETRVRLWDMASGRSKTTLIEHTSAVESLVFSPDGSTLASGSSDKTVRLWGVASGRLKVLLTGHLERVNSVAFSPDGSTLASGSSDKTVRLWDVASGQTTTIFTGHTREVQSVAFSPDGSTLASGSYDETVRLWNVSSRQLKTTLTGNMNWTSSVAFSPDGNTLASGGSNAIHLWDVASGQRKSLLIGHTREVRSVAFSPDGSTLASGSSDKTVRLWDVALGQLTAILTGSTSGDLGIDSVAFSPDGSTLASGSGESIHLWDLTASATTPAIVSISPASTQPLTIGEQLTVSLNIVGGENVMGYQVTVVFDPSVLLYFSSDNGEYLSDGAFFAAPVVEKNSVTLASSALTGGSNGDGTLASLTFQVVDTKASGLFLSQATLIDPEGERLFPCIENGTAGDDTMEHSTLIVPVYLAEDVNSDGVVNIQDMVLVSSNFGKRGKNKADINGDGIVDIVDLVRVAGALRDAAAAPFFHPQTLTMLTTADVQSWFTQAQHLNLTDIRSQRGVRLLEQLLVVLTPQETILLPNYPNPFNPETWIPYHLANPSDVQIVIYDTRGITVRRLALGHQSEGYYTTHSRAAYWDGRNDLGERVATGIYFYQLQTDKQAGNMSLLRKMVILK